MIAPLLFVGLGCFAAGVGVTVIRLTGFSLSALFLIGSGVICITAGLLLL